jgi:hypothetical protein
LLLWARHGKRGWHGACYRTFNPPCLPNRKQLRTPRARPSVIHEPRVHQTTVAAAITSAAKRLRFNNEMKLTRSEGVCVRPLQLISVFCRPDAPLQDDLYVVTL